MTRKDYPMLAAALAKIDNYDVRAEAVHYVANALAADNPHGFDRARFLRDCGV